MIRTGSEKVADQCKQNIFAIQTLNEFQYIEEGKDQGHNVREKAKLLVSLLRDDERLKNERTKALKARERFAQHPSGFGSDGSVEGPTHRDQIALGWVEGSDRRGASSGGAGAVAVAGAAAPTGSEIEFMRPLTVGEEELQLQLAMAMSKEEAAQEEAKRRSDDVRLQLALSQSEQDFKKDDDDTPHQSQPPAPPQSHLLDLLDINLGATSISNNHHQQQQQHQPDAWSAMSGKSQPVMADPWARTTSPAPVDPWATASPVTVPQSGSDGWLGATGGGGAGGIGMGIGIGKTNGIPGMPATDPWLSKQAPVSADPWSGAGAMNNGLLNQINNNSNNNNNYNRGGIGADLDTWQNNNSSSNNNTNNSSNILNNNNNGQAPPSSDPWSLTMGARPSPVGAITSPATSEYDDFDIITNRSKSANNNNVDNINIGNKID